MIGVGWQHGSGLPFSALVWSLTFVLGMRVHSWVVGAVAALLLLVVDQGL
jgi:hypothetical protein